MCVPDMLSSSRASNSNKGPSHSANSHPSADNTFAFKMVPPRVRPLTAALLSATFTIAVSAITLGYVPGIPAAALPLPGPS